MEPFLGQIQPFGFNFAPRGWSKCDGQILPINSWQSLYSLLGTIYGGDGRTSFALPDLRGRAIVHQGTSTTGANYLIGQKAGAETETLTTSHIPSHVHVVSMPVSNDGAATDEANEGFLTDTATNFYAAGATPNSFYGSGVNTQNQGNSTPYNLMQPFQTINICIALQGLFPSRN